MSYQGSLSRDTITMENVSLDSTDPLLLVHPLYVNDERRESHAGKISPFMQKYISRIDEVVRRYPGELHVLDCWYFGSTRAYLMQHRKAPWTVHRVSEEMLDSAQKPFRALQRIRPQRVNLGGGNLDYVDIVNIPGERDPLISIGSCVGVIAERLLEQGFKINFCPDITYDCGEGVQEGYYMNTTLAKLRELNLLI